MVVNLVANKIALILILSSYLSSFSQMDAKKVLTTKVCIGCNLKGINLSSFNLSGANLRNSNLSGANLSSTNLKNANLSGTNLWRADLSGTNLYGCNLLGANLFQTDLTGANLTGSIYDKMSLKNIILRH